MTTPPLLPGELAIVRAFLASLPDHAPVSSAMARRLLATVDQVRDHAAVDLLIVSSKTLHRPKE